MHSLTLRHLLPGVQYANIAGVGGEDAITPIECGEIYRRAVPRARLVVSRIAVTCPRWEKPTELAGLIENFLAG